MAAMIWPELQIVGEESLGVVADVRYGFVALELYDFGGWTAAWAQSHSGGLVRQPRSRGQWVQREIPEMPK